MSEVPVTERDGYVPGYGLSAHRYMAGRTAPVAADFFVDHLQKGMRVLDCGCGAGPIEIGLAEIVSPGEVVGIDHEPAQVDRARALAAEQSALNVRFDVGDVFALSFADASFDAAFAHALLMHVGDRVAALRELRRVVRPGGVVGVKDLRTDQYVMEPLTPLLVEFMELLDRTRRHHGVPPSAPQLYRRLFREAGLVDVEGFASATAYGTTDAVHAIAAFHVSQARGEAFQRTVLEEGWATSSRLDEMCGEIEHWSEDADAFRVEWFCAAVGRVPTPESDDP